MSTTCRFWTTSLTGVSRFAKASVFSGLNNLNDMTLDKRYANICGYTQADMNTTLAAHLDQADMDDVRKIEIAARRMQLVTI